MGNGTVPTTFATAMYPTGTAGTIISVPTYAGHPYPEPTYINAPHPYPVESASESGVSASGSAVPSMEAYTGGAATRTVSVLAALGAVVAWIL
jgi:hypothetical protein